MDRTIPFPAKCLLYGGAKEVQNFNLKVHSGPEGSRGLDHDRNIVFCQKFHLKYLFRTSHDLTYAKFYFEVTTMAVNRSEKRQ